MEINVDYLLYGYFIIALAIYMTHKIIVTRIEKLEDNIIDEFKSISQSMKNGNGIETSFKESADKKNPCSSFFKKVISKMNQGNSLEESFRNVSKKSKSQLLIYLSDIISVSLSKGNITEALDRITNNVSKINFLERKTSEKLSSAITTIKFIAIGIMPAVFYFLSGILSTPELSIEVSLNLKIYLAGLVVYASFVDLILFKNIKESIFTLILGFSIYLLYI